MAARHGPDLSPDRSIPDHALHDDGEQVTTSPYPVVDPAWGWELNALLSVTTPGLAIRSRTDDQTGIATTWMSHGDGSWARAAGTSGEPAVVHQSGQRRLWDILDYYRGWWLTHGYLPLRGAGARIEPDSTCHLGQDQWHATIPPATPAV